MIRIGCHNVSLYSNFGCTLNYFDRLILRFNDKLTFYLLMRQNCRALEYLNDVIHHDIVRYIPHKILMYLYRKAVAAFHCGSI